MTTPQAPDIRRPIAQRLQAMGLFDHAAVPPTAPQVTIMEKPRTLGILTFILLIGLLGSLIAFTHLTQPDWPTRLQEIRTTDWLTLLREVKITVVEQVSYLISLPTTPPSLTTPQTIAPSPQITLPPPAARLAATMDNSPAPLPEAIPVAIPVPAPVMPVVEAPTPAVAAVENRTPAPAAPTVVAAPSAPTAPSTAQPVYYYPPNPYYYAPPPQPYYYQPYYYQPPAPTQ